MSSKSAILVGSLFFLSGCLDIPPAVEKEIIDEAEKIAIEIGEDIVKEVTQPKD